MPTADASVPSPPHLCTHPIGLVLRDRRLTPAIVCSASKPLMQASDTAANPCTEGNLKHTVGHWMEAGDHPLPLYQASPMSSALNQACTCG